MRATLTTSGGAPITGKQLTFRILRSDRSEIISLGGTTGSKADGSPTQDPGVAECELTITSDFPPPAQPLIVSVAFPGDDNYDACTAETQLTLRPCATTLATVSDFATVGAGKATITATLHDEVGSGVPGRTLTVSVNNGPVQTMDPSSSAGVTAKTFDLPLTTEPGEIPYTVTFAGEERYLASEASGTIVVGTERERIATEVEAFDAVVHCWGRTVLRAIVRRADTHVGVVGLAVRFYVDGSCVGSAGSAAADGGATPPREDGEARLVYDVPQEWWPGEHTLVAEFGGNAVCAPSGSEQKTLSVIKSISTIALSNIGAHAPGQSVGLTAVLRCEGGLYQRFVRFSLNGTGVTDGRTDGQGVVRASFVLGDAIPPGVGTVTAHYDGDDVRGSCSDAKPITIVAAPTDITVADTFGDAGAGGTVTARLRRTTDYGGVSSRRIDFTIDGTSAGHAATGTGGWALLDVALPPGMAPGAHPVAASFGGDPSYGGSSATGTLTVRQPTILAVEDATGPPATAVSLRSQVLLQSDGSPVVGISVTYSLEGTYVGAATTAADGIASLTWEVTDGPLSRILGAEFAGDSTYSGSSAEGTFTLVAGETTLSVDDAESAPGATAAIRAHLVRVQDGGGVGGKSVSLTLDGTEIGTVTTDDQGAASHDYTVPWTMTAGSHALGAQFSGDARYNPSSGSGTLTLTQAECLLEVSDAEGVPGGLVSAKATLKRTSDEVGIPERTVAFGLEGTALGSAETNGEGLASLTHRIAADLVPGTYTLDAAFAGDATFLECAGTGQLTLTHVPTELLVNDVFAEPGTSATLAACLRRTDGAKPGILGKDVSFAVDGTGAGTASTDENGMSRVPYAVPVGLTTNPTISASFGGDATYAASEGSGTLRLGKAILRISLVSLTRQGGQIVATITIRNTGTAPASACRVTLASLRSTATVTPVPVIVGDIAPGTAGTNVQLAWNGSVGSPGLAAILRVAAAHATGSASSSLRVKLP